MSEHGPVPCPSGLLCPGVDMSSLFCTAEICRLSPPCTTRSTHPVTGWMQDRNFWPGHRCESMTRQGGRRLEPWVPEQIFAGMPWRAAYRQCGGETSREHLFFPKSYGEYDDGPACPCSCRMAEKFCRNIQTSCSGVSVVPEKTALHEHARHPAFMRIPAWAEAAFLSA